MPSCAPWCDRTDRYGAEYPCFRVALYLLQNSAAGCRLMVFSVRIPVRTQSPSRMRFGWKARFAKGIRPMDDTSSIPVKRMSKLVNGTVARGRKSAVRVPRRSKYDKGWRESTDKSSILVRQRLIQSRRISLNGEKSDIP
jgi:hypothetical protein